jgi:membrane protein YqaA with SNARE-associated domain
MTTPPPEAGPLARPGGLLRTIGGLPRRLYDWVLHWAATPYAVAALALLSFAEASFFPVPPDVLLIAMCLGMRQRALTFALVCSLASVAGGLLGYGIGALAWDQLSEHFYRWIPGFSAAKFERVQALYNEWGVLIVFTAGFTPIPFKLFTIVSGVMDLPILPFLGASAVGRSLRFFLVAGMIYRFGEPVRAFIDRYFNWLALAFTVLLVGGFAALKLLG